jgi:hypothetical protein
MRHFFQHATRQAGRRSFLLGTAGALAAGLTTSLFRPGLSKADSGTLPLPEHIFVPLPAPKPIPGGFDIRRSSTNSSPARRRSPCPSRSLPCKA